jgi:hypothetical protein
MPDNDSINKALADAKATLAHSPMIPNPTPAASSPADAHKSAPYSMAREARDTGTSINYNLKQAKTANDTLK